MNRKTLLPRLSLLSAFLLLGACGGDDEASGDTERDEAPAKRPDGGRDGGRDGGKRDARVDDEGDDDDDEACRSGEARSCDDCDEATCVQACVRGTWGACAGVDSVVSGVLDSGIADFLRDGGVRAVEGGVVVSAGDASITLPTSECASPFVCASKSMGAAGTLIGMQLMGASFCAMDDFIGLPPMCQTAADCQTAGLKQAMCTPLGPLGSYCIQLCQ